MQIRVYGPGCYRCEVLAENARLAVAKLGIDATVEEVHDLIQMVALGIITTPTLVVDGRVVMSGKVSSVEELQEVFGRSPVTA